MNVHLSEKRIEDRMSSKCRRSSIMKGNQQSWIVADLTEFKRAQESYSRKSKQAFLHHNVGDGKHHLSSTNTGGSNWFNPASEQMFGCSEVEAMEPSMIVFIAASDSDKNPATTICLQHSIVSLLEGRVRTINGIRHHWWSFSCEASTQRWISGTKNLTPISPLGNHCWHE